MLKTFAKFYCSRTGNSGNIALVSEKRSAVLGISNSIPEHKIHHEVDHSDSSRNSDHKFVQKDSMLKETHDILSNLNREVLPDPCKALENIRHKNINRLIFAQLNINSLRNKFDSPQHIINKYTDVMLISETKIDSSFPSFQFHLEGYVTSYRFDRNANDGGILLYIRENISSTLLISDLSIEGFFVEIRLRKKT